ncbi:MAG: hypothetical protein WB797_13215 [Nocardioides sp.]
MTGDVALWLAVGGLAVLCLVLLLTTTRARRAWAHERSQARAEMAELRARLDDLDRVGQSSIVTPAEFVITGLGTEPSEETRTPSVDGAVFADTVLRETVVKAASLAHGVRRGLAPATRNRIRFEMKQEVRRARKQRRADLKAAQRDLHARQRAMLAEEAS